MTVAIPTQIGEHVTSVAKRACAEADTLDAPVFFEFNGHKVVVPPSSDPQNICAQYERTCQEASDRYWTKDRKHAQKKEQSANQAAFGEHVATLDDLNFEDIDACIRWLCVFERRKLIYTTVQTDVVEVFEQHGYHPNENVKGEEESSEHWEARMGLDGEKRWLVGQALACIRFIGSPHGMIHTFAERLFARTPVEASILD